MTDPVTRLNAALQGRYRIEREIGEGGIARRVRALYGASLTMGPSGPAAAVDAP